MPTVQVTLPSGDLSSEQKTEMANRLTDTVSGFFHEQKQEDIRSFVMVQIHETAENGYAVGGEIIG